MAKYGESGYMGAWSYVGLEILYCIPVIGWIFLIVHCFTSSHENRMHFARSFFAKLLIVIIISAILCLVLYLTVGRQYFDHQAEVQRVFDQYSREYQEVTDRMMDRLNQIQFN